MTLDIIVPHYDEPWEEGKKLFDMLALQRDIDFSDFRVILVDDGGEHDVFPDVIRQKYPFEVTGVQIPHGGVSAARNAGMDHSGAKWILFHDFDDMFTSVYALRGIFDVLGTEDYDLLWTPFYVEVNEARKRQTKEEMNLVFIHGKIFRRDFLVNHGIRFCEELYFSEDTAFCAVVDMEIDHERIGKIKSEIVPYVWTFRPGSITTDPGKGYANAVGLFRRQTYVAEEARKRGDMEHFRGYVARAACDAYVTICRTDRDWDTTEFRAEALAYLREHWDDLAAAPAETVKAALRGSIREGSLREKPEISLEDWLNNFVGEVVT